MAAKTPISISRHFNLNFKNLNFKFKNRLRHRMLQASSTFRCNVIIQVFIPLLVLTLWIWAALRKLTKG